MMESKTESMNVAGRTKQFEIDGVMVKPASSELIVDNVPILVEDKVMKVLVYLITNPDRIVSREELFKHIWPNVFVSQASLNRCIAILRKLLNDQSSKPRIIRTIRNQGYRIICPVHSLEDKQEIRKRPTFQNGFKKAVQMSYGIITIMAAIFLVTIFFCVIAGSVG
ncbi:winged helix-turn-helix domain-containing protein [Fulvivirgaceae bacterium BMA10]|uniref:Winged helix-turn-helix domain-containing protein n=1 Tax=Splendidivirga corallicola TaxID=3051826 RepID=A0ABT8L007_9BACT|nr:winged helix-turn-helix domain-containing protein [Fulvivirgaceae bacterium BMA10]